MKNKIVKLSIFFLLAALLFSGCKEFWHPEGAEDTVEDIKEGIGSAGPGGGTVFFAQGGQYKECSRELGTYNWDDAKTTAENFRGGGFTDWYLPDRGELQLMYDNLHKNKKGGFYDEYYWSSTESSFSYAYILGFSNGRWNELYKTYNSRVRAVRSFTK